MSGSTHPDDSFLDLIPNASMQERADAMRALAAGANDADELRLFLEALDLVEGEK